MNFVIFAILLQHALYISHETQKVICQILDFIIHWVSQKLTFLMTFDRIEYFRFLLIFIVNSYHPSRSSYFTSILLIFVIQFHQQPTIDSFDLIAYDVRNLINFNRWWLILKKSDTIFLQEDMKQAIDEYSEYYTIYASLMNISIDHKFWLMVLLDLEHYINFDKKNHICYPCFFACDEIFHQKFQK